MARQVTGWWDGPGPPGVDGRMGRYCRSPKQARSAVCTVTRAWGEFRAPSPGAPGTLSTLASPVVALKLRLWCAQLGQVAGLQASTVLLALFRPLRPSWAAGATIRHRGSLFSLHFCARQQIKQALGEQDAGAADAAANHGSLEEGLLSWRRLAHVIRGPLGAAPHHLVA